MSLTELKQIDNLFDLPSPDGPHCPRCESEWSYWLNKPPEGQIGSGPYYFFCWYCENEWSFDEHELRAGEEEY